MKTVVVLGILLFLPCRSFATEQLIIPEMCVERAKNIGIFHNKSQTESTKDRLQISKAAWQVYDFKAMFDAYEKTLLEVSSQMENYRSPLFKHLQECKNSGRTCHGWFTTHNPLHVNIFCDPIIFLSAFKNVYAIKESRFNKCVNQPYDLVSENDLLGQPQLQYDKTCFEKTTMDGDPFVKNKQHKYLQELKYLENWDQKFTKTTINVVKKTLIPEGIDYIFQKVLEEFSELSIGQNKAYDHNSRYLTLDLISTFQGCCENTSAQTTSGQTSLRTLSYQLAEMNGQPPAEVGITFQTLDLLSDLIFDQAEAQGWKERIATNSPLEFTVNEKVAYFEYLKKNPYLYMESRTFSDFVKETKMHSRSDYYYRLPTEEELEQSSAQWDQYKSKMGYKDYAQFETYNVNTNDERQVINHFLFHPDFKIPYLQMVKDEQKEAEEVRFENYKTQEYPKIFKGFLPYQFERTAQAKIIRELQKTTKENAAVILGSFEKFHSWANKITCSGFETTYCKPSPPPLPGKEKKLNLHEEKHKDLYSKIITEVIPIQYHEGSSARRYIYTDSMLKTINEKIKEVNQFCWNNAAPDKYRKDQKSFENQKSKLDQLMKNFYAIHGFEELLGQEDFYKAIEFNFSTHMSNCFTKGYAFGDKSLISTPAGRKIVKTIFVGVNSASIPSYTNIEAKDDGLSFQLAYHPSTFQLQVSDIQEIESTIEETLTTEFETLRKAYSYSEDLQKEFLEESAFKRLLALVDYAIANPSKEIGLYLCDLIKHADLSEYQYLQALQTVQTVAIVSVTVFTVVFFPVLAPEALVLYEAGAAILMAGSSLTTGYLEIKYYDQQSELTNLSVLTKNMHGVDALLLQEYYDDSISGTKTSVGMSLGFLMLFGFRPISQSIQKINRWRDKEYRLVSASRKRMLEDVVERTPEEKLQGAQRNDQGLVERVPESERFAIHDKVRDFVTDYKNVTDDQFFAFKKAIEEGQGGNFILTTWQSQLGKYVPIRPIAPRTPLQISIPRTAAPVEQAIGQMAASTYNAVFVNSYTFRLRMFLSKVWNARKLKDPLEAEDWMASMIQRAQKIKQQKGITIFTDDEIKAYMAQMKSFRLGEDGKIYRVLSAEKEEIMNTFLLNNVVDINSDTARKYLEPFLHGNQLSLQDWKVVQTYFTRKIHSINDCKLFIKVLKFAKREYSFLREQSKNSPELLNRRELWEKYVYKKRFELIAKDIDEFFGIARYTAYKNDVRLVDDLKGVFENAQKSGKNLDEIETAIRTKYDPDFSFTKKLEEYDRNKAYIGRFDEKGVVNSHYLLKQTLKELQKNEQALISSYKKQFLDLEKKYNDLMHRHILRNIKKGLDVASSYGRALLRTQNAKQAEYECSLPGTQVKMEANRAYKRTAGLISLSTNFYGYWSNHKDEEKDWEWLGRFTYEMVAPAMVGQVQAKYFTKGGGPVYKTFREWLVGVGSSTADATGYWAAGQLTWNKNEQLENDFKKLIYESPDVQKTIEEFFKNHPEVRDRILGEFSKIKDVFEELELKNYRGTMVTSQMEDAFIRAGLIDNVLYSDMELKDRELGQDYLYHELIENGYLDEDLYRNSESNEDLENQIYELLGEIRYNSIYDEKNDELDLPLLDPIEVDGNWPEIRTGSEAFDRGLFNPIYDAAKTPIAYPKNLAVYWLLCKARNWPGNSNVVAAWALHLTYKAYMDSFKFYAREQMTGR